MARIFVLGTGPLLETGSKIMSGQCLRTWHFCKPLLDDGHEVRLITVPIPGTTGKPGDPLEIPASYENFDHGALTHNDEGTLLPYLKEAIDQFQPDALLGINAWPAFLLASLGTAIPFWADLNGWTMAEGLARGAVLGDDGDFAHFWRLEARTIHAAHRFSTVTSRQLYALQGEMAMLGAIDRHRVATPIGEVIPNAVHPLFAKLERKDSLPEWLDLPASARVCLWSGGFNSWTDVPGLVLGLEMLCARDPDFHLVCTGGAVHGHDEKTWEDFQTAVASSLPPGKVHLLGWIELEKVLELHQSVHLGINIDGDNLETRFGARNRLTNMMGAGLPVLTTRGTEIAEWIEHRDLGVVIPAGDPAVLADSMFQAMHDRERVHARAVTARKVVLEEFLAANTMAPVLEWARNPPPIINRDGDTPQNRLAMWVSSQCEHPRPEFLNGGSPSPHRSLPDRILGKLKGYLKT
ncbi:MAG: glycosyltransferase [Candidatus Sumerlaeia bacterium]|nr:glycosyltransferase [Candidatus Sumerlaeia bacterium]